MSLNTNVVPPLTSKKRITQISNKLKRLKRATTEEKTNKTLNQMREITPNPLGSKGKQ